MKQTDWPDSQHWLRHAAALLTARCRCVTFGFELGSCVGATLEKLATQSQNFSICPMTKDGKPYDHKQCLNGQWVPSDTLVSGIQNRVEADLNSARRVRSQHIGKVARFRELSMPWDGNTAPLPTERIELNITINACIDTLALTLGGNSLDVEMARLQFRYADLTDDALLKCLQAYPELPGVNALHADVNRNRAKPGELDDYGRPCFMAHRRGDVQALVNNCVNRKSGGGLADDAL